MSKYFFYFGRNFLSQTNTEFFKTILYNSSNRQLKAFKTKLFSEGEGGGFIIKLYDSEKVTKIAYFL